MPRASNVVTSCCMFGSICAYQSFSSAFRMPHACGGVQASKVWSLSWSVRSYHGSGSAAEGLATSVTSWFILMKEETLCASLPLQCSKRCSSVPTGDPRTGAAWPHAVRSGMHAGQNLSAKSIRLYLPGPPSLLWRMEDMWDGMVLFCVRMRSRLDTRLASLRFVMYGNGWNGDFVSDAVSNLRSWSRWVFLRYCAGLPDAMAVIEVIASRGWSFTHCRVSSYSLRASLPAMWLIQRRLRVFGAIWWRGWSNGVMFKFVFSQLCVCCSSVSVVCIFAESDRCDTLLTLCLSAYCIFVNSAFAGMVSACWEICEKIRSVAILASVAAEGMPRSERKALCTQSVFQTFGQKMEARDRLICLSSRFRWIGSHRNGKHVSVVDHTSCFHSVS